MRLEDFLSVNIIRTGSLIINMCSTELRRPLKITEIVLHILFALKSRKGTVSVCSICISDILLNVTLCPPIPFVFCASWSSLVITWDFITKLDCVGWYVLGYDWDICVSDNAKTVTLDFSSQLLRSYSDFSIDLSFMLNGIELRCLVLMA